MPKKCLVKCVLSEQQHDILRKFYEKYGLSESSTLELALMDYSKELGLM